ncbi:MAG: hypothetical protein M3P95_00810, partial [Actinomycetota bacterium]|nr:hypothetical protein [Actinomycetota bacterium]
MLPADHPLAALTEVPLGASTPCSLMRKPATSRSQLGAHAPRSAWMAERERNGVLLQVRANLVGHPRRGLAHLPR